MSDASNEPIPDMNNVVGSHDIVFITLDALRHDVAQRLYEAGELPVLQRYLPPGGWEKRHAPGNFTYASHQAFFSGFLPTPAKPGRHARLFATSFNGSETTTAQTRVFQQETITAGLAAEGYHTICIGGVGFFNKQTRLGSVLPEMFAESHWHPTMGVGNRHSTDHQVALALARLQATAQRVFLFINVAAIHAPNRHYLKGCKTDNLESHAAALRHVDAALRPLLETCSQRARLSSSSAQTTALLTAKMDFSAIALAMKLSGRCRTRISSFHKQSNVSDLAES